MALVYRCCWAIDWTEFERGWGARPDGSTVYESLQEAENAIAEHWAAERKRVPSGAVPDWYMLLPSAPYAAIVDNETGKVVVVGRANH